jgi:hypothetical protein
LGKFSDAYEGVFAFGTKPFVIFGVLEVGWKIHKKNLGCEYTIFDLRKT